MPPQANTRIKGPRDSAMAGPQDRRSARRYTRFEADTLLIEVKQAGGRRIIDGALVDVSEGGLGVTLRTPMAIDTEVKVEGWLARQHEFMLLRGWARVAHCTHQEDDGLFRAGLAFHEFHCQRPDGVPASLR